MELNSQILSILKKLGIGTGYDIPEEDDLSGVGAEFEILTLEAVLEIIEDSKWFAKGYIPIGECLQGTGNYYYTQLNTTQQSLFRITAESNEPEKVLASIAKVSGYRGK